MRDAVGDVWKRGKTMSDCKAGLRNGPIADALTGVWTLRQYSDVTDRLPPHYPFGNDPEGLLIYTPDGFASALLRARNRPNLRAFAPNMVGSTQQVHARST
jgi:hypothetical protein